MRVCVGGTFNVIHKGHELLFETAFSVGDEVEVGLTSDEFARSSRSVDVTPYEQRRRHLESFLARFGKPYDVVKIGDRFGTAAESPRIEAIVVSPETRDMAEEINAARRERGLRPLKVFCIREVVAEDSATISATRVVRGEIDREGRLLRPIKVAVGSTNKVKVDAVRNIFTQAFGLVDVVAVEPNHGIERQPQEERVVEGAVRRANNAIRSASADFGVGIEAGLFMNEHVGRKLDVQYCAIVDSSGRMTMGHGPGFEYPPVVIEAVERGATVGDTMAAITGIDQIGRNQGSVGYLSDGLIDRTSLTEIAVLMALIPRIRRDLYGAGASQDACSSSSETASR